MRLKCPGGARSAELHGRGGWALRTAGSCGRADEGQDAPTASREYPVLRVQTREPPAIPLLSVCRCGIKGELKLWARFQRLSCYQRIQIQKHEPFRAAVETSQKFMISVSEVSSVLWPGKE